METGHPGMKLANGKTGSFSLASCEPPQWRVEWGGLGADFLCFCSDSAGVFHLENEHPQSLSSGNENCTLSSGLCLDTHRASHSCSRSCVQLYQSLGCADVCTTDIFICCWGGRLAVSLKDTSGS